MALRQSAFDSLLIRSEGPTFDNQIHDEDLAGSVMSGTIPVDLSLDPGMGMARRRTIRGEPECLRGIGTTLVRERTVTN